MGHGTLTLVTVRVSEFPLSSVSVAFEISRTHKNLTILKSFRDWMSSYWTKICSSRKNCMFWFRRARWGFLLLLLIDLYLDQIFRKSLRDTCEFRCDEDYLRIGSASAICQNNGTWSENVPECKLNPFRIMKKCPELKISITVTAECTKYVQSMFINIIMLYV